MTDTNRHASAAVPSVGARPQLLVAIVAMTLLSVAAWLGHPVLAMMLALFPVLMMMAPVRLGPLALALVYFAVGNRDIPWMVQRFFEADHGPGITIAGGWIAAAALTAIQAAPFALVSPLHSPTRRFWTFALALILLTVPPIGLVAWRSPLLAAGAFFPGTGYVGVVAMTGLLSALAAGRFGFDRQTLVPTTVGAMSLLVFALSMWNAAVSPPPVAMPGWLAINTRVDPRAPRSMDLSQGELIAGQLSYALVPGIEVIVLPESTFNPLTLADQVSMNVVDVEARKRGIAILAGAYAQTATGAGDNTLIGFGTMAGVVDRSRSPMPLGNWRPGFHGGVPARPFATDTIEVRSASGAHKVAVSICFEDTVLWPHPGLLSGQAEAMVSVGNAWALTGTSAERTQATSAHLIAALAGVPLVRATNRLPEDSH